MKTQLEIIRKGRQSLIGIVSELTDEQLNKIPEGYNNNIIWNLGHLIASQQGLCYVRSGKPIVVDEGYLKLFKPETKPVGTISSAAIETIKQLLLPTIDRMESDYEQGHFSDFKTFLNRYGVELRNIEDCINFMVFHEGLHYGYVLALKRAVVNESNSK
ncbi:DinB family protein [Cytophaga hutchinsonii]|uniref:DinB-like domain-containing protein n=1 Tax=Cytophaga hutchinsonii (strain ATCC 33406 / DSM 1761 / CIP 103989 / NBRC 15051 / NCIMB 9469 / D465) TaxID=269798 RepID=A0A6N4SRW3_CYTH3|nr:DinB family protein [Cytophaga hutchinsonii]ABG59027.1 conserved hypothetical protein [Cytophaga hutchinsonii ATCC 33406]SFX38643.1 DinB superfamily protein [Cytophaga hutchinsonii ATCC 33406]